MITSSGGSSIDPNNVTDRLQEVKKYFTNEGLQFRKVIAQGNHGGAVLFAQWLPRQLVTKYALDTQEDATSDNDADLRNEFGWLRRFRGAEHIIQVLPEYNHLWRTNNDNNQGRGNDVGTGPVLSHPVIVMEYLENGTLDQLINRFGRIERRFPQRLLWSFALCCEFSYSRAVAAISYPAQLDGRRRREVARDEPPSLITQNSWKAPKVLVGDMREEGDAEHSLAPRAQAHRFRPRPRGGPRGGRGLEGALRVLEEYGRGGMGKFKSRLSSTRYTHIPLYTHTHIVFLLPSPHVSPTLKSRVYPIHPSTPATKTTPSADTASSPKTQVLQDLADAPNRRDLYRESDYRVWRASASAVFDPYDFYTDAHAHVLGNERLDKALRDLIAMCLAGQRHKLPTLREFLTLGRAGRRKTAEQFRHLYDQKKEKKEDDDGQGQGRNQEQNQGQGGTEAMGGEEWLCETDEAIHELLQRIVFDADFDPQRYSDAALQELGVAMTAEFLATLSMET
ncbi:hypothetical protein PG997_004942 [Apiospora hydei]|uniref:Protein kinase domain-containing protein n=1 Tax=Apiospora hydei TaxID=1337664 RepID=A0ABR1X3L3_9PEZI